MTNPERRGDPTTVSAPVGSDAVVLGWLDPGIVALALLALFSGFGQFGAVTALGDVASAFGHVTSGSTIADRAGLSGTAIGLGLAVVRLASLGSLPIAGAADRFGRRRILLLSCTFGLACTIAAAASPSYWWFVAIFALGRPLLSTTNAVVQVDTAEQTSTHDRAKAIALVTAGYGVGAGLTAIIHGPVHRLLGFRGIFLLAALPLITLPLIRRRIHEPDRFTIAASGSEHPMPVLGPVGTSFRRRLGIVSGIAFALAVVTGPGNSFVFLYADDVLKLAGSTIVVMVLVASVIGLAGLLLGRIGADRLGRRMTGALSMVAIAGATALTYSGSRAGLLVGYELQIFSASTLAPAAGALTNELFPTSVRASVAGWLVAASVIGGTAGLLAFGAIADVGNRFGAGAVATAGPVALASGLFFLLPETKGCELA